jgi:mannose-1-phosphate guanylyltransferase
LKAVVLAAGVGSRLGELTARTPKCLLPVARRPLLDYWFESLRAAGVTELFINLHHLPEQVEAYLREQQWGVKAKPFFEPELLGSAGTLRAAREFIGSDEEFLIIYADNFARVDLSRLLEFHRNRGNPCLTLVAYPTDRPSECGILDLAPDGRVVSFEEKPAVPRSKLANSGIHVAGLELFDYLPATTPADIGFHVLPKLVGKMYGYATNETIIDIGTPEKYEAAQRLALAASAN